jgi:hypothetical protein
VRSCLGIVRCAPVEPYKYLSTLGGNTPTEPHPHENVSCHPSTEHAILDWPFPATILNDDTRGSLCHRLVSLYPVSSLSYIIPLERTDPYLNAIYVRWRTDSTSSIQAASQATNSNPEEWRSRQRERAASETVVPSC